MSISCLASSYAAESTFQDFEVDIFCHPHNTCCAITTGHVQPESFRLTGSLLDHYNRLGTWKRNVSSYFPSEMAPKHSAWRLLFAQRTSVLRSCLNGRGYLVNRYSDDSLRNNTCSIAISEYHQNSLDLEVITLGCHSSQDMCWLFLD